MLGKSTFVVSCLLASTGNAVLNADSVNAYQKHLVDSKRHTSNQAEKPHSHPGIIMQEPHPGATIYVDPTPQPQPKP